MLTFFNVILSLILCVYHFTDYSWVGTFSDMVFPLLVGVVSLGSTPFLRFGFGYAKIIPNLLAICLNTILGIVPYILLIIFSPLMLLGLLFAGSEYANERVIEREISPNGRYIAIVKYHEVGAYTSGCGAFHVSLVDKRIPLIERDLYGKGTRKCADDGKFVEWVDNNTLYFPENDKFIKIGLVKFLISKLLIFSIFPILFFIAYVVNLFI